MKEKRNSRNKHIGKDPKLPERTRRLGLLIEKLTGETNQTKFVEILNGHLPEGEKAISQQSINRLFNIDKRYGKYPEVSGNIIVAISYLAEVSMDWFLWGKENETGDKENDKIAELEMKLKKVNKINDNYSDYIDQLKSKIERLEKELSKYEPKPTKHVSQ